MMIFDAHADILTDMYEEAKKGNNNAFREKHLVKYKQSGITHSIFVNWTNPNTRTSEDFYNCFDISIKTLKSNQDIFAICENYNDIQNAQTNGKIGVVLGVEGLKFLDKPTDIIALYNKGIRHASLTWNEVNDYGSGVSDTEFGLTANGIKLIKLMEELGMIIDLSHANYKTFSDVISITKGPVVVTHGNAKALCSHRRNYTDEQLMMIKEKNGVIGVCAVASFISTNKAEQTVKYLAKHIDYIVNLIGIDHVGIGLDVCYYLDEDNTSTNVEGLETISELYNLIKVLKSMGYKDELIDKITHKNFDRVLKQVL